MAKTLSFLCLPLLMSSFSYGMYQRLSEQITPDQAQKIIKQYILEKLAPLQSMANEDTILSHVFMPYPAHDTIRLAENTVAFHLHETLNKHIEKKKYTFNPYSENLKDWYKRLPTKERKKIATKLVENKKLVAFAFAR